jgi:leader peptidase (prepilin peptidase) / N-methyltransferase
MQTNIIINTLVLIWLFLCSLQDLRKKKIHVALIAIGFLVIFLYSMRTVDLPIWNRLIGLSLGAILLLLNPITRGQIGLGDGLIACVLGLSLGFSITAGMLIIGMFGSAILSLILIIFRKANKKTTIPFVPFLLIGFLGVLFT